MATDCHFRAHFSWQGRMKGVSRVTSIGPAAIKHESGFPLIRRGGGMKGHHIASFSALNTKDNPLGHFSIFCVDLKGGSVSSWFWAPILKSNDPEFKSFFDHQHFPPNLRG